MPSKATDDKRARKPEGAESLAGSAIDPPTLSKILELLERSGVTSLDWRRDGERLIVRRGVEPAPHSLGHLPHLSHAPAASSGHMPSPVVHASPPAATPPAKKEEPKGTVVTSPLVGTFYRAPSADAPAFVEEGQTVRKGQVLCIVEAMKLMNEIEAELAGKVIEVIAQNGQTVEFGQALFRIEPS